MTTLSEIEARLKEVTGGDWEAILPDDKRGQPVPYYRGLICCVSHEDPSGMLAVVSDGRTVPKSEWEANARLIASAKSDIAFLLPLARAMEMEWRDISTAPKDGTPILAFAPDSQWEEPFIVRWFDDELDPDDSGWFEAPDFTGGRVDVEVTHWMPLPALPSPPTSTEEKE